MTVNTALPCSECGICETGLPRHPIQPKDTRFSLADGIQVEQLRQTLLAQQLDYGLKLAGIGDQIVAGAIRSGWEADQRAQQVQNGYFNSMFRILGGLPNPTKAA